MTPKHFLLLAVMLMTLSAKAQTKSAKIGLAYESVYMSGFVHSGVSINSGTDFNIISDRIRFNPNIVIGYHYIEFVSDESYFGSVIPLTLETNIFFDIIRSKDNVFSWTWGLGAFGSALATFSGFGAEFGAQLFTGLTFTPKEANYSIEVLPFNIKIGIPEVFAYYPRVSVKYRL